MSVSYVLLGPFMAIIRPIAAICSAIVAGVLVGRDDDKQQVKPAAGADIKTSCCAAKPAEPEAKTSCCAAKPAEPEAKTSCCAPKSAEPEVKTSCCDTPNAAPQSQWQKMRQAISFSCNKLLSDTMVWLMIGLFFAALVQTYVPESFLTQWGSGILAMLVVILISIPMYICATASTPIAAGLLLSGVSPGAVLVFMLVGPATNIATLGVVANELGKRAVAAYLIGVIGVALIFGFLTDYLVTEFGFVVTPLLGEEHQVLPHWLSVVCGVILMALILRLVVIASQAKLKVTGKSIA